MVSKSKDKPRNIQEWIEHLDKPEGWPAPVSCSDMAKILKAIQEEHNHIENEIERVREDMAIWDHDHDCRYASEGHSHLEL